MENFNFCAVPFKKRKILNRIFLFELVLQIDLDCDCLFFRLDQREKD